MRKMTVLIGSLLAATLAMSCGGGAAAFQPETIIALERAALDRWGKGDPQGYLEIFAPEVTYFDPSQEKRVEGLEAMKQYLLPVTGKVQVERYEMIDPKVQRHGDAAVLTYNLISYMQPPGGPAVAVRWNSTEIYARTGGNWRIVHSHWSFTKPEIKGPGRE